MEKLDKVIAGLTLCGCENFCCPGCPYESLDWCEDEMMRDALDLLKELSADNQRLTRSLKVARLQRNQAWEKIARITGEREVEWLEKVRPEWYERLSNLDYNYNPVKDGTPWYRAEDVWSCVEEIPDGHREFGAHMDEEVVDD